MAEIYSFEACSLAQTRSLELGVSNYLNHVVWAILYGNFYTPPAFLNKVAIQILLSCVILFPFKKIIKTYKNI